jgi:hypothetical protein
MFDANKFKKLTKQWIRENPNGTVADLVDYCEEQIPAPQYAANEWLINQTIEWYKHILIHREAAKSYEYEEDATV